MINSNRLGEVWWVDGFEGCVRTRTIEPAPLLPLPPLSPHQPYPPSSSQTLAIILLPGRRKRHVLREHHIIIQLFKTMIKCVFAICWNRFKWTMSTGGGVTIR